MNQYSRYIHLKSIIEDVLGSEAWYALKESNYLPTWKKQLTKVVKAVHVSIMASVDIFDEAWIEQINEAVAAGKKNIGSATDIEEAIASLAAVFINVSFLQVGLMPMHKGNSKRILLRADHWRLNRFRTVMYVQDSQQENALFRYQQRRKLGTQQEMSLWAEYLRSKSKLKYSDWVN